MVRPMNRLAWVLLSLGLSACGSCSGPATQLPGDEQLGTYALNVKGIRAVCTLATFPNTFSYTGSFSRFTDGGRVIFTSVASNGDTDKFDGGFDGQFAFFVRSEGPTAGSSYGLADGGSCAPCDMRQTQGGVLALVSPSQNAALGEMCPTTALDGGLPPPDADAGIFLPTFNDDGGFNAVRACGEQTVTITGEGFCDPICNSCVLQYRVSGERVF